MEQLDANAPIVPNEGLGGIQLRRGIGDYQEMIQASLWVRASLDYSLVSPFEARYRCRDVGVEVAVDVRNGKIFKITAWEGYRGALLEKVRVGMLVQDAMEKIPALYYDEAEALILMRGEDGVTLDVSEDDPPVEQVPGLRIEAISVIAQEVWTAAGADGEW